MVPILEKVNMEATATVIKVLLDAFTEECVTEIANQRRPNTGEVDIFNIGLSSADAAIKRVKTRYMERLENQINQETNERIY